MRIKMTLEQARRLHRLVTATDDADLRSLLETALDQALRLQVCPVCGQTFTQETVGRVGQYDSQACKQKAYRQRKRTWLQQTARPP